MHLDYILLGAFVLFVAIGLVAPGCKARAFFIVAQPLNSNEVANTKAIIRFFKIGLEEVARGSSENLPPR